jgi:hypothetical protein
MSEPAPAVVRLGDPSDVVNAVPHLLGFRPAESLVAVALSGPRARMGFCVRVDLPRSRDSFDPVVWTAVRAMRRARARSVLLFVYTEAVPDEFGLPHERLVDTVASDLPMPVRDAYLVARGRVWSYGCDDSRCCPAEGRALDPSTPGAVALSAAATLTGRSVLPDRETAVASVQPVGGLTATSMHQAIGRVSGRFADLDRADVRAEVRRLWAALVARCRDPRAHPTHDEAATVIVGLHDVGLRDEILAGLDHGDDVEERLLVELVRLAQPPDDPPVCTVLACAAYLAGNGVVAGAALERALGSDPDYGLARLIDGALVNQVHPDLLRSALAVGVRRRGRGADPR